jgi:hypothetical protein
MNAPAGIRSVQDACTGIGRKCHLDQGSVGPPSAPRKGLCESTTCRAFGFSAPPIPFCPLVALDVTTGLFRMEAAMFLLYSHSGL